MSEEERLAEAIAAAVAERHAFLTKPDNWDTFSHIAARVALAHRDEQLRELKAAVRGFEADAKLARSAGLGVSGTRAFAVVAAARRLLMEETK